MENVSVTNLFNDVSIYSKEKFEIFSLKDGKYNLNNNELEKMIAYIGIKQEKIITFCHKCKMQFPYNMQIEPFHFEKNCLTMDDGMYFASSSQSGMAYISFTSGKIFGPQPPYDEKKMLNNKIWYANYFLTCTKDESHKYIMMISIELKDGSFIVRKIGQNPSMLTIKGFDFDKYKKQLEIINAYDDYKKADLSNADHFYVGAYAYLRRIFEKMVNKYLDGQQLKDNHMDTKINAIKDKFDPRIQKMLKNLYGILSVSIHELDEEDSKEYYIYLKAIIDIQLEYEKTEQDKENQSKELETVLNKIANGISTNGGEK